MRKPQPHAISVETSRRPRRNPVDAGGARVAPHPVKADSTARRRSLQLLVVATVAFLLTLTVGGVPDARADPATRAYATLGLSDVTPTTVTGSTGDTVTVSGRIVNTDTRPISDIGVRLQRGNAITASSELRSSLTLPPNSFGISSGQAKVIRSLAPGKSVDFTLTVPITGYDGLNLMRAGVYPLLVNVLGTPADGGAVSIADSRTLLPVLSLPPNSERAREYVDPAAGAASNPLLGRDGSIAANSTSPSAFTMIWPLAAPPQTAAGTLGGETAELRLTSDAMASSLQADGRLGLSLAALEELAGIGAAPTPGTDDEQSAPADEHNPVRDSICLAVDPDLLTTVSEMARGYVITIDPANPDAATYPGQGAKAAANWLTRLKAVASRMCVTALPFAQAGLDSLYTINDANLSKSAVLDPYTVVDEMLGVQTVRGLTLPATGTLTDNGQELLSTLGVEAAAIASTSMSPIGADTAPTAGTPSGRYKHGELSLQTYDAAITAALGGAGITPVVPAITPNWQQPTLSHESAASRRQSAAAALTFPMLSGPIAQTDDQPAPDLPATGRSAFIMPPTYWSPTLQDARTFRDTAALMLSSGTARPVPLATLLDEMPAVNARARLEVPGDIEPDAAAGYPITQHDAETVRQRLGAIDRMQSSLVGNNDTVTTPVDYMQPLRDDLIRSVSSASTTDSAAIRERRDQRLTAVGKSLNSMQQAVSLLDPSGRYTLASERSPLLLVVRNNLALPIKVRLDVDAPPTLEIADLGTFEIPAAGTRQLQIPTHASSSEPATVHIGLITSSDIPLSTPIELSVYANAYGKALFWITIGAAIILIALTARRLWHRFKGEPDPADEDRPEPDAEDLEQATLGYQRRLDLQEAPDGDSGPRDTGGVS
ncbi:MAG: hypothetical protein WBA98_10220 [Gordonia sp. (in: high G+C Gram-positive bacteria)]|uniref:hypothetical protein n=1 Tax=Gordonia sp. (in: high G+C Gram-positive bacteria) TaxID=84139 RepID=UPI003C764EE6